MKHVYFILLNIWKQNFEERMSDSTFSYFSKVDGHVRQYFKIWRNCGRDTKRGVLNKPAPPSPSLPVWKMAKAMVVEFRVLPPMTCALVKDINPLVSVQLSSAHLPTRIRAVSLNEILPNALRRKHNPHWTGGFSLGVDLGMSRTGLALSKGFSVRPLSVITFYSLSIALYFSL